MPLIAGVDAGGSATVAAARRDDDETTVVRSGAANPNAAGIAAAADTIAIAVLEACRGAAPDAIAAGVAGAGRQAVRDALTAALRARFPSARVAVADDAAIAMRAAVPGGDALLVIAGTGSLAYGEIGDRVLRAGGYGFAIGDDGSGHAIGAAALRHALRALEGRTPPDGLSAAVAAVAGASRDDVFGFAYGTSPVAAIAGVAPIVVERAADGERSAVKILQAAALELFELVRSLCRQAGAGAAELPIVFSGGLLRRNSLLTYLLETRVANELPYLCIVKDGPDPYEGALAAARALLA